MAVGVRFGMASNGVVRQQRCGELRNVVFRSVWAVGVGYGEVSSARLGQAGLGEAVMATLGKLRNVVAVIVLAVEVRLGTLRSLCVVAVGVGMCPVG